MNAWRKAWHAVIGDRDRVIRCRPAQACTLKFHLSLILLYSDIIDHPIWFILYDPFAVTSCVRGLGETRCREFLRKKPWDSREYEHASSCAALRCFAVRIYTVIPILAE
jgi:hypothetical protein